MKIYVKDGDFVIPGQLIGENINCNLEYCIVEGNKVYSTVEGLVRVNRKNVKIIPSFGGYIPKKDDIVIGVVIEVLPSGWVMDINSPYLCIMEGEEATEEVFKSNLKDFFDVGDIISAKVSEVNEVNSCKVVNPKKLIGGIVVDVNPKRIPRILGKKRSMLLLLREKTQCRIIVGQNGRVWIKGENTPIAIEAIKKIEREAQTKGLTDRIERMLDEKLGMVKKKNEK
ncbi:MAG TPA: RNA-binding protein [Candidatus Altiarchaeales archaeon]|nr:MAG: RNA-binding protein [Candidatus Altiarchaeales archaeon]HDN83518.1 RNA-binding protein [Candidatus Altiarchaeales archaeon]